MSGCRSRSSAPSSKRIRNCVDPRAVVEEGDVRLERGGCRGVAQPPLHSADVTRCRGDDRPVRMAKHVKADRGDADANTRRIEHAPPVVHLIEARTAFTGEDELTLWGPAVAET